MGPVGGIARFSSLLTLQGSRSLLLTQPYRTLVGLIGIAYVLITTLFSGMLYLPASPQHIGWFLFVFPSGPGPSWTYPAILAGGPYFQVDLPVLSTILMTLTAAGIGLGMSLAIQLGVRLLRLRSAGMFRPTAAAAVAGWTPALVALLTLGACCSTAAAATAGIGLASHSGVIGAAALGGDAEYLGAVQVGVVYIALIAQEYLVRVIGRIPGGPLRPSGAVSASSIAVDPSPSPDSSN